MKQIIPEYLTLADIFRDAIDKENDAEKFYLQASELAQTAELRDFLVGLARMEREHAELLGKKLESFQADKTVMDGILSSYGEDNAE
jgi:rubrerythrin